MHELAISSAIVDTVVRHARGRRVGSVHLRIGALRQVVPESLAFYFEITSRDSVCEGAELDLEPVSAVMRCRGCEGEWDPAPEPLHEGDPAAVLPQFRCPRCGAAGAEVVAGNELTVDSIDVIDATHRAPAGPVPTANGVHPRQPQAS